MARSSFDELLLHEFLLEPELVDEFGIAEAMRKRVGSDGATLTMLSGNMVFGEPISAVVLTVVQKQVSKLHNTATITRSVADILATLKSESDKYHSCCRSAICYGVVGKPSRAIKPLLVAASVNDNWARHHHNFGLIQGLENNLEEAQFELHLALEREPYEDARMRIQEAQRICAEMLTVTG